MRVATGLRRSPCVAPRLRCRWSDAVIGRHASHRRHPSPHRGRLAHRGAPGRPSLTRLLRDLVVAEEMAQDALVAALEQSPGSRPAREARRLADDDGAAAEPSTICAVQRWPRASTCSSAPRRRNCRARTTTDMDTRRRRGDDLLRLVFTACHPVLSAEARVALTLRLLGGLTTPRDRPRVPAAGATIAQRIVRAKRTLAHKQVPFELPPESSWRRGWPRCWRSST